MQLATSSSAKTATTFELIGLAVRFAALAVACAASLRVASFQLAVLIVAVPLCSSMSANHLR